MSKKQNPNNFTLSVIYSVSTDPLPLKLNLGSYRNEGMKAYPINVISLIFIVLSFTGCSFNHYNRGNCLYENLSYDHAIEEYIQVRSAANMPDARIKIADCYRKLNNNKQAEFWYSQVVKTPEVSPIYMLYYAQVLRQNGKQEEARIWYENYLVYVPEDTKAQLEMKNISPIVANID
ncbi:MAG: tetratricopeptide repeat protein [Bacteroidia bacterium]